MTISAVGGIKYICLKKAAVWNQGETGGGLAWLVSRSVTAVVSTAYKRVYNAPVKMFGYFGSSLVSGSNPHTRSLHRRTAQTKPRLTPSQGAEGEDKKNDSSARIKGTVNHIPVLV